MICAAVLCPGPPLLVPELSGPDPAAAELRAATEAAASALVAAGPDRVVVVGVADATADWPVGSPSGFGAFGGTARPSTMDSGSSLIDSVEAETPVSLAIGGWLLDRVGYRGPRSLRSIAEDAELEACQRLGVELAAGGDRTGLLVVADGSARRTVKAPGYLDPRAEPYDERVHQAIAAGELTALPELDPGLAGELLASGWPALQVLAAAFDGGPVRTEVHYADAPFGVGYLVASLRPTMG